MAGLASFFISRPRKFIRCKHQRSGQCTVVTDLTTFSILPHEDISLCGTRQITGSQTQHVLLNQAPIACTPT